MTRYTAAERNWLLTLTQQIVQRVTPDEERFVAAIADEFFKNPLVSVPTYEPDDDPMGSGYGETSIPAPLAVLIMLDAALKYTQEIEATTSSVAAPSLLDPTLWKTFRSTQGREALRERLYQTGRQYSMAPELIGQTVNQILGALIDTEQEPAAPRVINGWIADHPANMALQLAVTYRLCFNIATPRADARVTAGGVDQLSAILQPDQEAIAVDVFLVTDAFTINSREWQTMIVPRSGPSAPISFDITPQQVGQHRIIAIFNVNNQTFQRLEIDVQVGPVGSPDRIASFEQRARGETLESFLQSMEPQPTLSLVIVCRDAGYQLLLCGEVTQQAFINISPAEINWLIEQARGILHTIFHTTMQNLRVYQCETPTIPGPQYQQDLQQLARLGRFLFEKLFYHRRGDDVQAIGELLRHLMRRQSFNIRVVADRFVFPWTLLYIGTAQEPIDLNSFWGMRHVIGCVPQFNQSEPVHFQPQIDIGQEVRLAFVYGTGLQPGRNTWQALIEQHLVFFQSLPGVALSIHPTRASLFQLLNEQELPHIIYFFCHAMSFDTGLAGVAGQAHLTLTDGIVTLFDLESHILPRPSSLGQGPFVFLNACNSAVLSPHFYEGFVPCLINRGARGVLGTESEISPYFAAQFAQQLLSELLSGRATLGDILLRLRQQYVHKHANLLGLSYALHSSSNLILRRR